MHRLLLMQLNVERHIRELRLIETRIIAKENSRHLLGAPAITSRPRSSQGTHT